MPKNKITTTYCGCEERICSYSKCPDIHFIDSFHTTPYSWTGKGLETLLLAARRIPICPDIYRSVRRQDTLLDHVGEAFVYVQPVKVKTSAALLVAGFLTPRHQRGVRYAKIHRMGQDHTKRIRRDRTGRIYILADRLGFG